MVYANKAYNANPNHPYVLWIYGRVLIRYNHIDDGIKVLEHLFKIEPMALADVNTDRVVKELFVAYYLSGNYKKCNELFNQIYEHDFREWLIYIDIKWKENIDYIVTGSIRASDNKLRILIELSDMTDDRVIWTNKFDSASSDIFEIHDEIVTTIVTCLFGDIEISSLKRAHRQPPDNMTSYEYT